jgi:hypothetical protein
LFGKGTHFLAALSPMIWIIGKHARHRWGVISHRCNDSLCRELVGTSLRFRHWRYEGHQAFGARAMWNRRKKYEPTDWGFTMERIGRELGKIYRQPKRLPQRLRAVVMQLERKVPVRRGRQRGK